jgi:hypothetical protein
MTSPIAVVVAVIVVAAVRGSKGKRREREKQQERESFHTQSSFIHLSGSWGREEASTRCVCRVAASRESGGADNCPFRRRESIR